MKRITLFSTVLFALIIFSGVSELQVQANDWRLLGTRNVGDRLDHDTIVVTGLRGDFKKIKLKVSRTAVRFYRVEITFGNGSTQKVAMRSLVKDGGETKAIDLRGKDRVISKVEFWYEAKSLGRKTARISLWGRD